jgi:hypothetical protein
VSTLPDCNASKPLLAAIDTELSEYNYVEHEYTISGTAAIYAYNSSTLPRHVDNTGTTDYTVRILVRRPADMENNFDGGVIVEYLNPTANVDFDFVWGFTADYIMRTGKVWVGVTLKTVPNNYLKSWNSCRYASLNFPNLGAYPDFTRDLGLKLKSLDSDNPLGNYPAQRLILTSFSQSGGQVVTFMNDFHQHARLSNNAPIFDGYYLCDPTSNGAQDPSTAARYNDDRRYINFANLPGIPIIRTRTENLLTNEFSRRVAVRQRDSTPQDLYKFRNYELLGAHLNDAMMARIKFIGERDHINIGLGLIPPFSCQNPDSIVRVSDFYKANLEQLDTWITNGISPPKGEDKLIELSGPIPSDTDTTSVQPTILRDSYGVALGGIRMTDIAVPIGSNNVVNLPLAGITTDWCAAKLRGTFSAFTPTMLDSLYKNHGKYVSKVAQSAYQLVQAKLLLWDEAEQVVEKAAKSDVGKRRGPRHYEGDD